MPRDIDFQCRIYVFGNDCLYDVELETVTATPIGCYSAPSGLTAVGTSACFVAADEGSSLRSLRCAEGGAGWVSEVFVPDGIDLDCDGVADQC